MKNNNLTINPKRPIGISIISFLFLSSGGFIMALYFFAPSEIVDTNFSVKKIFGFLIMLLMFVGAFAFSMRKKWGWWIISVISFSNVLLDIIALAKVTESILENNPNFYLQNFGALIFHILILIYLFQKNVFEYFVFNSKTVLKKFVVVMLSSSVIYSFSFIIYN